MNTEIRNPFDAVQENEAMRSSGMQHALCASTSVSVDFTKNSCMNEVDVFKEHAVDKNQVRSR